MFHNAAVVAALVPATVNNAVAVAVAVAVATTAPAHAPAVVGNADDEQFILPATNNRGGEVPAPTAATTTFVVAVAVVGRAVVPFRHVVADDDRCWSWCSFLPVDFLL